MKLVQVLLIFTAIIGWCAGADSPRAYKAINSKLTNNVLMYMDDSAVPCTDFYQFACGKWTEVHGDKHSSAFELASYEADMDLIRYMDNTKMANQPEFVKKAYELYTSCTGKQYFDEFDSIDWFLKRANLKWAMFEDNIKSDDVDGSNEGFDWVRSLAMFRRYGMNNVFIEEYNYVNDDEPAENIVGLNKPANSEGGFSTLTREQFAKLNDAAAPFGFEGIGKFWEDFASFEELLIQLYNAESNNTATLFRAEQLSPEWLNKYMTIVLGKESLDPNMKISVKNMAYIEALDSLVKIFPTKFICSYLEIRFLWHLYTKENQFTEMSCIATTRRHLPAAVDWIYGKMYPMLERAAPEINDMFGDLVKHINKTLRADEKGIIPESFLKKLDTMQLKIGNYPRANTKELLDTFYANLTFDTRNFYGNLLDLIAHHYDYVHTLTTNELDVKNIDQFFDMDILFDVAPLQLQYLPSENVIYVPMAILRQPIYHWAYSNFYKYSTLGTILANKVYSILSLDGFTMNEMKTLAEVSSIHTSFEAFVPQFLNELPINRDKHVSVKMLYFVNAAQMMCHSDDTQYSPVNDIVSHLPEFTATFECKLNTFLEIFSHLSMN